MTRCSGAAEGSGGLPPMVGGEVLSLGSCLEESSPSMGSSLMTRLPPTVPGSAPASTFELTLLTEDGATEEGGAILAEAGVMVAVTLRLARLLVAPQLMSEESCGSFSPSEVDEESRMDSEAVRFPPPPVDPVMVEGAVVFAVVGVVTKLLLLPASTVKLRATLKGSAFFFGFDADSFFGELTNPLILRVSAAARNEGSRALGKLTLPV